MILKYLNGFKLNRVLAWQIEDERKRLETQKIEVTAIVEKIKKNVSLDYNEYTSCVKVTYHLTYMYISVDGSGGLWEGEIKN